jgi:hypothetical protein
VACIQVLAGRPASNAAGAAAAALTMVNGVAAAAVTLHR